jgi:hypothetical protein
MNDLGPIIRKRQRADAVAQQTAVPDDSSNDPRPLKKARSSEPAESTPEAPKPSKPEPKFKPSKPTGRDVAAANSSRRHDRAGYNRAIKSENAETTNAPAGDNSEGETGDDSDIEMGEDSDSETDEDEIDAVPVPVVRANDHVNNPILVAITDSTVKAAYLREVGNRNIYMTDPMKSANSDVKVHGRYTIKAKLMKGYTNEQCVRGYNNRGGKLNKDNLENAGKGIDKTFKQNVPGWFSEENIVMPWAARRQADEMNFRSKD